MTIKLKIRNFFKLHAQSISGSYSIIFFSQNKIFAFLLILATMISPVAGLTGLAGTVITNLIAWLVGLPESKIRSGLYGFNSLLVSVAIGTLFQVSPMIFLLLPVAMIITLIFSVLLDGILGKYHLPFLSLPFLFGLWVLVLAWVCENSSGMFPGCIEKTQSFFIPAVFQSFESSLGNGLPSLLVFYFKGLASIFFSESILTGLLIAAGILVFSRIALLLSFLGYISAFLFYQSMGIVIDSTNIMQFGFNYILTAIALGGFFYIPSSGSFLLAVIMTPLVSVIFSATSGLLARIGLAPYSLPFNIIVISVLYVLMFRVRHFRWIQPAVVQTYSPENNLYGHHNDEYRFGKFVLPVSIPVTGPWKITQGHDGSETHRDAYRHAWDFQIADDKDLVFQGAGTMLKDYYCFGKPVYAPAEGIVEEIINDVPDNPVGEINQSQNWGNTVVIRHTPYLYSKLSHLKEQSVAVKKGDTVRKGDLIAQVGNSGRSPFPHLHFQLQSTPFIGSQTLNYPLSSFYYLKDGNSEFIEQGIPEQDKTVSALLPDYLMRKVFHLIPGMIIEIESTDKSGRKEILEWKVMSDMANQYYISCSKTNAVAYFMVRNDVFYFLSYYGSRKALLYKFYTGFHKIITGIEKTAVSNDRIPINMGKYKSLLFLQDFIAPFFRFITFNYSVHSEKTDDNLLSNSIKINTTADQKIFGISLWRMQSMMQIESGDRISILFEEKNISVKATCSVSYSY